MTTREKIIAALGKFGPMTSVQMSEHVDAKWLSTIAHQLAKGGELKILGGGKRSSIYGLPGQKAETAEHPAKPKRAKKRSAPVRKVQRKTARKVQKTVTVSRRSLAREAPVLRTPRADLRIPYADAAASAFRTAIASDGAMIFLGATGGPFELTRPESRALIDFVRTLDRAGLAA